MMDPLSITASVVTLIQISAQVTVLVKQFRDEVNVVDATLNGILKDVDGFQQVQEDIKANLQLTGHVGNHWKNLARSLNDGETTLGQLQTLLKSINKSTSFMDAPRKQLRLKAAVVQIAEYRDQIQSYHAALQLSPSTVILWNQVHLQKTTDSIPGKIMPDLNKLYDEFRSLGANLNAKIEKLMTSVSSQHVDAELVSMNNLRECVRSAADVVSTASTTLAPETSERISVMYGSDFGDILTTDSNETMLRWISSNTVYEFEDTEAPPLEPSESSAGNVLTEEHSDSDSGINNDLMRALFTSGKRCKQRGDLHAAERKFRNCLSRIPKNSRYMSLLAPPTLTMDGVSKMELLEHLTETYCSLELWMEAKTMMVEKLALTERQADKKSERFLWDTLQLVEILIKDEEYAEAQLHCRRSLKGFKTLRQAGRQGYERSLHLLIQLCKKQDNSEEEEAYEDLLAIHEARVRRPQMAPDTQAATTEMSQDLSDNIAEALDESTAKLHKVELDSVRTAVAPEARLRTEQGTTETQFSTSSAISEGTASSLVLPHALAKRKSSLSQVAGLTLPTIVRQAAVTADQGEGSLLNNGDMPRSGDLTPTRTLTSSHNSSVLSDIKITEYASNAPKQPDFDFPVFPNFGAPTVPDLDTNKSDGKTIDSVSDKEAVVAHPSTIMDPAAYTSHEATVAASGSADGLQANLISRIADQGTLDMPSSAHDPAVRRALSDSRLPWMKSLPLNPQPNTTEDNKGTMGQSETILCEDRLAHRGVPSTSTHFPEWIPGDDRVLSKPRATSALPHLLQVGGVTGNSTSTARPKVTFDDPIEKSVYKTDHTNLDPVSPISHSFSLFPASLAKTFSLQNHRRKSEKSKPRKRPSLRFSLRSSSSTQESPSKTRKIPMSRHQACPVCFTSLLQLTNDEVSVHVDNCLDGSLTAVGEAPHELPAPEPFSGLFELPADFPGDVCDPGALLAHLPLTMSRPQIAGSRSGPSFDKFKPQSAVDAVSTALRPCRTSINLGPAQRQVLLLGNTGCGKSWLLSTWYNRETPSRKSVLANETYIKQHGTGSDRVELVIQDRSGLDCNLGHDVTSYGDVHVVLICFDISDVYSFESAAQLWFQRCNAQFEDVPRLLVGCKKDKRSQQWFGPTVLSRDAFGVTAKNCARGYFETSAVSMEGIDLLFEKIAELARSYDAQKLKTADRRRSHSQCPDLSDYLDLQSLELYLKRRDASGSVKCNTDDARH